MSALPPLPNLVLGTSVDTLDQKASLINFIHISFVLGVEKPKLIW